MGMKITHVSKDKVEAEIFVREELNNRFGAMHGGAVMALADNLGGTATFANLPAGGRTATIESKTNFFAPIPGRRHRARRMHAAASRPHHHGLADPHHPQRRQAVRAGDADADRDCAGEELARGYSEMPATKSPGKTAGRERQPAAFASSGSTSPPARTMACACWSTGCGRGASPSGRRTSICGCETSLQATSCVAWCMPTRQNGMNSSRPMGASSSRSRRGRRFADLRKLPRSQPVTLLYAARDEAHNNAVALKRWLERAK